MAFEGFLAFLRGIYYFFEDRYYGLLDKLDSVIPVYKIIDPIDRVVPSFVLFFLLFILLVLFILFFVQLFSSSSYELLVLDNVSFDTVEGARVFGDVGGFYFDELTGSDGKAIFSTDGEGSNIFDLIVRIFFGNAVYNVSAEISSEKDGYEPVVGLPLDLSSKKAIIYLRKISFDFNGGPDLPDYPNKTTVILTDQKTGEKIVDDSGMASVSFKCANKNISTKTVFDNAGGSIDGEFVLNEPACQFVLVSASSPGYADALDLPKTLPSWMSRHYIELYRNSVDQTGRAKIYVSQKGSSPKKYLSNVLVKLFDSQGFVGGSGYTDNSGVVLISGNDLYPGDYLITAASSDNNYAALTADANLKINIIAGRTTEASIELEKIDPVLVRVVKLVVVDSNSKSPISGVLAFPQKINSLGVSNGNSAGYCANGCLTGANGQITVSGFSISDSNKLVVVLNKGGYLVKVIKPPLVLPSDSYFLVELEKATSLNSGSAKVLVRSQNSGFYLAGARTNLFMNLANPSVSNISIVEDGVLTDRNGEAFYFGLTPGSDKNYFASAVYRGSYSSPHPPKKLLSPGTQIDFNLLINMALSIIEIELVDVNNNPIPAASGAKVALYDINANNELIGSTLENLVFDSNKGFFTSGLRVKHSMMAKITLNNFVPNFLSVSENDLSNSINHFVVRLYPLSGDSNVMVYFDGFYKFPVKPVLGGRDSLLNLENDYYARFDVVAQKDFNYSDLFGSAQFVSNAKIVGLDNQVITDFGFKQKGVFTRIPADVSSSGRVNDDNFYIQSGEFLTTHDSNLGLSAGVRWGNSLPAGVYSFSPVMRFLSGVTNESVIRMKYFGKERHSNFVSESRGEYSFSIGGVIVPPGQGDGNASFYLRAKVNDSSVDLPNEFSYNSASKRFFMSAEETSGVSSEYSNNLNISIVNGSDLDLNNVSVSFYSYLGPSTEFNFLPSGYLHFDSKSGPQEKRLPETGSFSVSGKSSFDVNAVFFSSSKKSHSYIVALIKVGLGAGAKNYLLFIDTYSAGDKLILSGANFLAGVPDQNFSGEVLSYSTKAPVDLDRVLLEVKKKCANSDQSSANYQKLNADINGNFFVGSIPGVYDYGESCVVVSAFAKDPNFERLVVTIKAGSGGVADPSLSCMEGKFLSADDLKNVFLGWGAITELKIRNGCSVNMQAVVETGLLSEAIGESSCSNLAPLAECSVRIIAKNVSFDSGVRFSDLLGLFPVYVKARKIGSAKRMALADTLFVHVNNQSECFSISKDLFDLRVDSDMSIVINDSCQYTGIKDYYIPRAVLLAQGASLELDRPDYDFVDVTYSVLAGSEGYSFETVSSPVETFVHRQVEAASLTASNLTGLEANYKRYTRVVFDFPDFNGSSDNFLFKWGDSSSSDLYGAKFEAFTIHYRDGSTQTISPLVNFDLNSKKCVCNDGVIPSGGVCFRSNSPNNEECMWGDERCTGFDYCQDANIKYSLGYVFFQKGNVSRIEFDVIGNPVPDNLIIFGILKVNYNKSNSIVRLVSGNRSSQVIHSAVFRINPVEGMTYVIKNLGRSIVRDTDLENIEICKKFLSHELWIDGDYAYWTERAAANYALAGEYCSSNIGREFILNGSLVLDAPESLMRSIASTPFIVNGSQLGFWTGNCDENSCAVLKYIPTAGNGFILARADKKIIGSYLPLCFMEISSKNKVNENLCAGLGVTCDSNGLNCDVPNSSEFSIFSDSSYVSQANPTIDVNVVSVRSGSTVLNPSSVTVWVEGGLIKARFLGEDFLAFNSGKISGKVVAENFTGKEYGKLNVVDYVTRRN